MERKEWVTPRVMVEEFEANEYVAACWQIACAVGAKGGVDYPNPDPMPWNEGQTHSHNSDDTGCGWSHSQYIREVGNDIFTVTEYGANILDCDLTRNADWSDLSNTIANVKPGEKIYWTTSLGNRTWHHWGVVSVAEQDHPNRS